MVERLGIERRETFPQEAFGPVGGDDYAYLCLSGFVLLHSLTHIFLQKVLQILLYGITDMIGLEGTDALLPEPCHLVGP